MKKVLILGAGMVVKPIVRYLLDKGFAVTVATRTKSKADAWGVCGWVRNLPDGSVEAVFEGEPSRVEAVLDWCRQGGPPAARVDQVKTSEQALTEKCDGFDIRY